MMGDKRIYIVAKVFNLRGCIAYRCKTLNEARCVPGTLEALRADGVQTTGELLDGHSLVFLCRKATAAGAPLKGTLRDCAYVNQFYIETRYPSDSYMPVSEEEARDCMDAARKLMELLA